MIDTPISVVAPLVATAALLGVAWALRQPRSGRLLGPAADFWEYGRRLLLPLLDRLLRRHAPGQHYAAYQLSLDEVVGTIDATPEAVEQLLWESGAKRMPLAALKTLPDGRVERGSWAYRDSLLASKQIHVMLFSAGEGRTLVAAHEEANALNPAVAMDHYRGRGYDVPAGERAVRERLDEGVWAEE
ncbi:hypothetical protein [Halolamina rubra]|uniref:hypothetical protein n=1 Tax=Halolamina rubra TaxID=1380430 RepID=UPI0006787D79|nr:hypothetical protein [Halolamina rubra]